MMKNLDLSQIPLFKTLPSAEIKHLNEVLKPISLDPDVVLCHEGEPGDKFYIITTGQVEIIKSLGTPDEQILGNRNPGDFLGEMSLLVPDGLRTATVRASSAVELLELSYADFDQLLKKRPSLAMEMVRELSIRLRHSDNTMIRDLTEKNQELAQAYQELKAAQAQIVEKEKLEHELSLARQIQQSILPDDLALMAGFDFGARMVPARAVGGDLYDFIQLDQDTMGISIGDVSDKGVPAAIFMALYCSLLRAEAPYAPSPAEVLRRVNHHLINMRDTGMFVTALFGVLNQKTSQFSYARAGHHVPILIDDFGKEMAINRDQGQLLGFFPDPVLDIQTVDLPQGSTLLLYSDGMLDVMDSNNEFIGENRFREIVQGSRGKSAQELCEYIITELKNIQGDNPQYDDMTLVAVQHI
jgi:serine phosphatase RsbU (regulator of sigma subunit)